jgi:hypothetical protein
MNEQKLRAEIRKAIKEEMNAYGVHTDHEATMARAEIKDMIKNGAELYNQIQEGDELPGWVSGYITLASDYIHSVYEYMQEKKSN